MDIAVQKVAESRVNTIDIENPAFGREFTDHMFIVDYEDGEWKDARIVPYGDMPVSPALSCFHYGQAIFEGMKAYKSDDDEIFLFRPEDNHARLNRSAERMCMPKLPKDIFFDGLEAWLRLDSNWIPKGKDASLYIRPFMIATDDYLGVKPSSKYRFIIYGCPVSAYYSDRLKIKVEQNLVRAAAGGVGEAKAAGNYAASMYGARKAQEKGFHQLLWTDAAEHKYLEELGTSNFFMYTKNNELITPELDGTILRGITRDSIVKLAKHLGVNVTERKISVDELQDALENGQIQSLFATGTAATIADIGLVGIGDKTYDVPEIRDGIVSRLKNGLKDIQAGRAEDPFGWRQTVANPQSA